MLIQQSFALCGFDGGLHLSLENSSSVQDSTVDSIKTNNCIRL